MPTTYVGTSAFFPSITIPVDGDLADAASVNGAAMDEIDTQIFLLQTYGQLMQSTCPIRARWSTLISLDIEPIPFMAVTESGTWKSIFTTMLTNVSETDLEGGGSFAINTWYFVYAYSIGGVANFQISAQMPDQYFLYKNGTFSHKYICSFKTNTLGQILPFEKYGNYVTYEASLAVGGGSSTIEAPLTTANYVPPSVNNAPRLCKLVGNADSTATFLPSTLTIRPRSGSGGYEFIIPALGAESIILETPTDDTGTVYYFLSDGSVSILFGLLGYYE